MNQGQPDPRAPESQPTRQGRRLIRMLFRSTIEDAKASDGETPEHDSRAEDAAAWKNSTKYQDNCDNAAVPAPTSKFASLKRKLFPSQNRRHPRHVPPLMINPINAPVKAPPSLPPIDKSRRSVSSEENQIIDCSSKSICTDNFKLKDSLEDTPEIDTYSAAEGDNNWRSGGRRTLIDDDDDRDLESAVEALDLESSIADKTLEEMNKAIDDLRAWKEIRDQETQKALSKMQAEEFQPHLAEPSEDPTTCDDHFAEHLELKRQQQQRDREAQTLELRKEAEAYQLECNAFRTTLDEVEATRVEQALQSSSDSEGLALSRLRNELFQLDVKQRQEALLQELQGDDNDLDMNMADVQAFTGELDAILAQFDTSSVHESNDEVQVTGFPG
ncbi:hypothetical protein PR003_g7173 [Phytophthora rubi]|uniref:Uncharacterized protein n=1 Tax=Phytophthora rubi TaxID=129364 RepID=A0A6A3N352_9STRA|nr:hypothetical protein PR002_g6198 [Phytophthora rubi]KAE9043277.1 hypothetical protein PR001_g5858 [Phytophthora rubi]KAE9346953.1 hypothetical protein PR003_g7173 [Phytophthora rubi]